MSTWVTVKKIEAIRNVGPHAWRGAKCFHWPFCKKCGLISLNNDVSRKAAKHPCEG